MSKEKQYRKVLLIIVETLEEEKVMPNLSSMIRKTIMKIEGIK